MTSSFLQGERYAAITFDLYGTLIDWATGTLVALHDLFDPYGIQASDAQLLDAFVRSRRAREAGRTEYETFRDKLAWTGAEIAQELGVTVKPEELERFSTSPTRWPAFPETLPALKRLSLHYRLGIVTNADDELAQASMDALGVEFDCLLTAQQVRATKPNPEIFRVLKDKLRVPASQLLHVATGLSHDIAPARAMGFSTALILRNSGADALNRAGAQGEYGSLATLAEVLTKPCESGSTPQKKRSHVEVWRPG